MRYDGDAHSEQVKLQTDWMIGQSSDTPLRPPLGDLGSVTKISADGRKHTYETCSVAHKMGFDLQSLPLSASPRPACLSRQLPHLLPEMKRPSLGVDGVMLDGTATFQAGVIHYTGTMQRDS